MLATKDGKGDGDYNYGRYTNPKLDELLAQIKVNMNPEQRMKEIHAALLAHNAETNHIPLHRQVIPWAERANVTVRAPRRQPGHAVLGDDKVIGSGRAM